MKVPAGIKEAFEKLPVKTRQWVVAGGLVLGLFGIVWLIITLGETDQSTKKPPPGVANGTGGPGVKVTNVDVVQPGSQVTAQDQWVGQAGKKLSQWEHDRRLIDRRFAELESKVGAGGKETSGGVATSSVERPTAAAMPGMVESNGPVGYPTGYPPANALGASGQSNDLPPKPADGAGPVEVKVAPERSLVRVSVTPVARLGSSSGQGGTVGSVGTQKLRDPPYRSSVETYLPVSFTRGVMLGGIDAPTGGQSQSNPHPVLIRLEDNAVLPNRFRSEVRECFVVAAGYGDISSERAYMRLENLSCVRNDGSTLEVEIKGAVYGDDGHVGVRGRLVEKQGQILAKALLAGLLSGVGQGLAMQGTTTTTTLVGLSATSDNSHAFQRGIGRGVGGALDRLANYYIRLAEQIFPVIEVDAGRMVDVVITKGVRIEVAESQQVSSGAKSKFSATMGGDDEY